MAVETVVAGSAPAQIPAHASTHWPPPLGAGVKTSVGSGMQDPGFR